MTAYACDQHGLTAQRYTCMAWLLRLRAHGTPSEDRNFTKAEPALCTASSLRPTRRGGAAVFKRTPNCCLVAVVFAHRAIISLAMQAGPTLSGM